MGVKSGLQRHLSSMPTSTERCVAESRIDLNIIKPLVNGREVRRYQIEYKRVDTI